MNIKQALYGLVIVAGLASCDGDYTDWANPQSNSAEALAAKVTASVAQPTEVNLKDVEGDSIQLFAISNTLDPSLTAKLSSCVAKLTNPDDATAAAVDISVSPQGKVAKSELSAAVVSFYGKAPKARAVNAALTEYFTTSSGMVFNVKVSPSVTFNVTPESPEISSAYYVMSDVSGWSVDGAKSQKFSHSDKDVYDDPEFTITIPAKEGSDTWFAIADDKALEAVGNGDWSQLYGVVGGSLEMDKACQIDRRAAMGKDNSFCVPASAGAKYISVTINMMDGTITAKALNFEKFFYEIGNESGWGTSNALYGANYDGKYQGFYYLNGEFKFKPNKENWDNDYEYDGDGKIKDGGTQGNCPDPGAGFYQIDVDLVAGTYALTKVNSITIVGQHNGWKQDDAACHMAYNQNHGCWEWTGTLQDGFKFAMNDAWGTSWGGANGDAANYGNLTYSNGKDLNVPRGDGEYMVQLYLSYEGANKVVLTKFN